LAPYNALQRWAKNAEAQSHRFLKEFEMNEQVQTGGRFGTAIGNDSAQRNKVLRNTYWLLALSMLPTVLGAWVGVQTGITAGLTGFVGLIVFLGGAFGFMYAIEKTKNSAAGVPVLLAFTFFMGLMLSRMLAMVLGFSNGASLVMTAFAGTAGVFLVMANLSTVIKRDLSGMGQWLFVGALAIMIGAVVNVFVGSPIVMAVIATLAIVVFSLYLLFDLKRIVDGGETNYISATLGLYLSLFNIFQSLLALLGIFGGDRE
jgi:modulator of FtsH protease